MGVDPEWASDCGDHVDTAHILYDWNTSVVGPSAIDVVPSITGMTGKCLRFLSSSNNAMLTKNLTSSATKRIHIRLSHDLPPTSYSEVIRWQNPGVGTNSVQVVIMVGTTGTVSAWRGQTFTNGSASIINGSYSAVTKLCESGPGVIAGGVGYVLSAQIVFSHLATGSVVLYVNGQQVASVSNVITTVDGTDAVQQCDVMQQAGSTITGYTYVDDVIIYDGTGTIPTPKRCQWISTSGAGASTGWTLHGAATNWQCVTDSTPQPDDDTTYNSAGAAGLVDLYTITAPGGIAGIAAIQAVMCPRTDDGGAATIAPVFGDGVSTAVGTAQAVGSSYGDLYQVHGTNPLTSNPWLVADLTGLQIGVKRVA